MSDLGGVDSHRGKEIEREREREREGSSVRKLEG
jgi:hypothetical protein